MDGLKSFFKDIKEKQIEIDVKHVIDVEGIDVKEPKNWYMEMMNHKITNLKPKGRRSMSDAAIAPPEITPNKFKMFHPPSLQTESKPHQPKPVKNSDNNNPTLYIDSKGSHRHHQWIYLMTISS